MTCSWNVNSQNSRYGVPKIPCSLRSAASARNIVGSAFLEEIVLVIVTSGLRRTSTPDLNSYVCCLWGTLKGKCSMNNPLLLGGGKSWKILLEEKLLTGIFQIKSSDVFPETISELSRFAWDLEAGSSGR